MEPKPNAVGLSCFIAWFFATMLVIMVSFQVIFVVQMLMGESAAWVGWVLMTGFYGLVIGITQWVILRQYEQISHSWITVTVFGFLISSPVFLYASGRFAVPSHEPIAALGHAGAFGILLGVAQGPVLHQTVNRSLRWIGISLLAWLFAGLISSLLAFLTGKILGVLLYYLALFFLGTVFSAGGMIWLLKGEGPPAYPVPA